MEKVKFKVGDIIGPVVPNMGVEEAVVTRVDGRNYYLKILCGTAIIPIKAQRNYKLKAR